MRKSIVANRIVKVIDGKAIGNRPGTIVKILSRPGRLTDQIALISTKLYVDKIMDKVLCESITGGNNTNTLNNKPVCYEYISDLQPATEYEKTQRKLNNQQPHDIIII